jgi:hypothetical protein
MFNAVIFRNRAYKMKFIKSILCFFFLLFIFQCSPTSPSNSAQYKIAGELVLLKFGCVAKIQSPKDSTSGCIGGWARWPIQYDSLNLLLHYGDTISPGQTVILPINNEKYSTAINFSRCYLTYKNIFIRQIDFYEAGVDSVYFVDTLRNAL